MYDDDQLKQFRRNFLRGNRPEEFRRLKREGQLEAHLQEHADACRSRAASLVEQGETFEAQAWQWAIRIVLLESLPD